MNDMTPLQRFAQRIRHAMEESYGMPLEECEETGCDCAYSRIDEILIEMESAS